MPERAARLLMAWVAVHDVTHGGFWQHDIGYFKRFRHAGSGNHAVAQLPKRIDLVLANRRLVLHHQDQLPLAGRNRLL